MAANHELHRRNKSLAMLACAVAFSMLGMAYAAVPLYDLFCRVTGYGGTTQTARAAPDKVLARRITVRFDASLNRHLPWRFEPPKPLSLRVGEQALAFYAAQNLTDQPIVGTATFNVSPQKAGIYFAKIDCFCFREQELRGGERVDMPVSFFIDPEIMTDPDMANIDTITLSYTFFAAKTDADSRKEGS